MINLFITLNIYGEFIRISIHDALIAGKTPAKTIKIQTELYELNVCLNPDEVSQLSTFLQNPYEIDKLKLGTCCENDVFWLCDGAMINILVGKGIKSWCFAVSIPIYMFQSLAC